MTHNTETETAPLVRLAHITKRFGGATVLADAQFEVRRGEVHILAGENGAGKSTLIKILAGVHTDFDGSIQINGREVRPKTPLEANALGVILGLCNFGRKEGRDEIPALRFLYRIQSAQAATADEDTRAGMRLINLSPDHNSSGSPSLKDVRDE